MLNTLKVNLKKSLLPDVCSLIMVFAFFALMIFQTSLFYVGNDNIIYATYDSTFTLYSSIFNIVILYLLFKNFSYNKTKVSCDLYYSLPVNKRTLYFANTLFSILEFVCFWLVLTLLLFIGFGVLEKPDTIEMRYGMIFLFTFYVFFYSIVNLLLLIPFVYFANDIVDSIGYLVFIILTPTLLLATLSNLFSILFYKGYISQSMATFDIAFCTPLLTVPFLGENFYDFFYNKPVYSKLWGASEWTSFILMIMIAAVAFISSIYFVSKDRAERSQEIDQKWFGYKVFLPIFVIILAAFFGFKSNESIDTISLLTCVIVPFILMVIKRRNFKIKMSDIVWIVVSPVSYLIFVGIAKLLS